MWSGVRAQWPQIIRVSLLNCARWPENTPGLALKGCFDIASMSHLSISAPCSAKFPKGMLVQARSPQLPLRSLRWLVPYLTTKLLLTNDWSPSLPVFLARSLSAFVHVEVTGTE